MDPVTGPKRLLTLLLVLFFLGLVVSRYSKYENFSFSQPIVNKLRLLIGDSIPDFRSLLCQIFVKSMHIMVFQFSTHIVPSVPRSKNVFPPVINCPTGSSWLQMQYRSTSPISTSSRKSRVSAVQSVAAANLLII